MAWLPEDEYRRQQAERRRARREEHAAYLRSAHWQQRRIRALERANHACEFSDEEDAPSCGSRINLEVHHLSYDRKGAELDEDLIVLCRAHHLTYELMKKCCMRCEAPVFDWLIDAAEFVADHLDFDPEAALDDMREDAPSLCPYCDHMTHKDD